jgi:WD40 repeat protein
MVGRYKVLKKLGNGGQGVVFCAQDSQLGRLVALKVLNQTDEDSDHSRVRVRRFQEEARIVSRLDHPRIVTLFESGQTDGKLWLAQKFCPGGTLADRLCEPVAPRLAATWVRDLADAVAYAHMCGVLHRDLKPSNVFFSADGSVCLGDFGIAKDERDGAEVERTSALWTMTGVAMGSPSYMAPEQALAQGDRIGARTDVYGLGTILYHALCGAPPFIGVTAAETFRKLLEDQPVRPRSLGGMIPVELETICLKCLEKDPERRYSAASELRDDLSRYLDGRRITARPETAIGGLLRLCRRHPIPALLSFGLAATLIVSVVVTNIQLSRTREANVRYLSIRDRQASESAYNSFIGGDTAGSLRGLLPLLDESADPDAVTSLVANLISTGRFCLVEQVYGRDACLGAAFHPSGKYLVLCTRVGTFEVRDAVSGALIHGPFQTGIQEITRVAIEARGQLLRIEGSDGTISHWQLPDGSKISSIGTMDSDLNDSILKSQMQYREGLVSETSPDKRIRLDEERVDGRVSLALRDAKTGKVVFQCPSKEERPIAASAFTETPEGSYFLTSANNQVFVRDSLSGALACEPIELRSEVEQVIWHPSLLKVLIITYNGPPTLWSVRVGRSQVKVASASSRVQAMHYSQDGRRILFSTDSDGFQSLVSGSLQHDVGGAAPTKSTVWSGPIGAGERSWGVTRKGLMFTFSPLSPDSIETRFDAQEELIAATVSNDGKWVATVRKDSLLQLWNLADGALVRATLLTKNVTEESRWGPFRVFSLDFSPDGSRIAAALSVGQAVCLSIPALDSTLSYETNSPVAFARFSPDGDSLAVGDFNGNVNLWMGRETLRPRMHLPHSARVLRGSFDSLGRYFASETADGSVRVWRLREGKLALEIPANSSTPVRFAQFVPGSRSDLLLVDAEGRIQVRSIPSGMITFSSNVPVGGVRYTVAFSHDKSQIAVCTAQSSTPQSTIHELPYAPFGVQRPPWFREMAEAVAGIRSLTDGSIEPVGYEAIARLRRRLTEEGVRDPKSLWGTVLGPL